MTNWLMVAPTLNIW